MNYDDDAWGADETPEPTPRWCIVCHRYGCGNGCPNWAPEFEVPSTENEA